MSSFMVSNESLREMATVLRDVVTNNFKIPDEFNKYRIKKLADEMGESEYNSPQYIYEDMFKALFNMNVDALGVRYDDADDMYSKIDEIPKPIEGEFGGVLWTEDYPLDNLPKFYKLCECYLYQCSESAEIEDRPLFKAVETMMNEVAGVYMRRSTAYREADWD